MFCSPYTRCQEGWYALQPMSTRPQRPGTLARIGAGIQAVRQARQRTRLHNQLFLFCQAMVRLSVTALNHSFGDRSHMWGLRHTVMVV